MSQFNRYSIQCSCNSMVDVELYDSVNITVDPSLSNKIKCRKINNFKCKNCGNGNELSYRFLYVDMQKGLWIWCYPLGDKANIKEIEKELNNGEVAIMNKLTERFGQQKPRIVFGYDELFDFI